MMGRGRAVDRQDPHSPAAVTARVQALLEEIGCPPQATNHADWMLYRHCRSGHGNEVALCFGAERYSYAELADAAGSCAAWLLSLGIGAGRSVILLMPDCPALAAAYFGVVTVQATAIILNPALPPEDLFYIAQLVQAEVVICHRPALAAARPLQHLRGMRAIEGADLGWRPSSRIADPIPVRHGPPPDHPRAALDDAYGLLTSGSTGRPKLIVHRHIDILYGHLAFASDVLAMSPADRTICAAKMSTGYGMGSSLLMPLLAGASAALVSEAPGRALIEAVETHGCTLLLGQPRLLAEALSMPGLPQKLRSLRLVVTGGEPLGASLVARWSAVCDAELLDAYGNTEVGFLYITNRPGAARPGSIGRPIAGVEVEIVDDAVRPLAPGASAASAASATSAASAASATPGILRVRGPSVIAAYRGLPEASRAHFVDGWFQTSDLASRDTDGYFRVHGRVDHFIKLGCGDWVNPHDLEATLLQDGRVNECAVVGVPDEAGLTVLKAVVVPADDATRTGALAAELAGLIRARWPAEAFRQVSVIEFADALPKTAAGKLDRAKLSPQSMTEFSYKC